MSTTQIRSNVAPTRSCTAARRIAAKAGKEDIYIGKGKYVKDDPKKYPSKSQWTGGWAGGEAGLWDFRDAVVVRPCNSSDGDKVSEGKPSGPATKLLGGKDVIYTGQGNYVRDDAKKYPSKSKMTGGFAGGEKGVKKFVADGDLSFEDEFRPQNSPLIVALAMSGVAIVISSVWFVIAE